MTKLSCLVNNICRKPKVILFAFYIMILLLLIIWTFPRRTYIKPEKITKVRIQNGLNGETIIVDDPDLIKDITKSLSKVYYCLGTKSSKGWLYSLHFYSDDKTIAYEFTINSKNSKSTYGIGKITYLKYHANANKLINKLSEFI